MKYGGTLLPNAETAKANITRVPLSAYVILSICLNPLRVTILFGFWTVCILKILPHLKHYII